MSSRAEFADHGPDRASPAGTPPSSRSLAEGPRTAYPREKTIAQAFKEQAARTPHELAVIASGRALTFRELDARTNQLARHIRECGVGPETCVGVALERSQEMLIALLAVLKAGGAYVPLDPSYPAARIRFIAEDAGMPVVLASSRTRSLLAGASARLICVDEEAAAIAAQSREPLAPRATGANLAYVIYTSGSTGAPKGVMIEHRNVLNFFAAMDRLLGTEPGIWLAVTSISFDISVLELFWSLARGFTVVIHTGEGAQGIAEEIRHYGVTHFQSTPSLARLLSLDERSLPGLAGLKALLLGGEALPAGLVRRLREFVKCEIFNMYGPTETTVWSAAQRVSELGATVPIGKPLANTQIYVLDEDGRPVAIGEAGEVHIGGEGVARGYWKRPTLTAERFQQDPFRTGSSSARGSLGPSARMYRTGDLARFLRDGSLEFLGRADFQVKIRGFRIELGEIEATIETHPGVQQAVVTAREDRPGDQRLIAYVVPRPGQSPQLDEMRRLLAARLPEHMMPAHFVSLTEFPLTANGKIDRRALPPPFADAPASASASRAAAPVSNGEPNLEQLIAQAWRDALGAGEIGWNENFFDLGAHSLMVPEVHMQLQRELGREFPLLDLFQFPTVAALANHLRESTDRASSKTPDASRPAAGPLAESRAARRLARRAALASRSQQHSP